MDYRPVFDKILLKEIPEKQEKTGLIIAAASFKTGVVIAAGNGKPGLPMVITNGQTVMYKKEDATDIRIEGETYKLLLERDTWMVKN